MILQNFRGRVVGCVLIKISPSNILPAILSLKDLIKAYSVCWPLCVLLEHGYSYCLYCVCKHPSRQYSVLTLNARSSQNSLPVLVKPSRQKQCCKIMLKNKCQAGHYQQLLFKYFEKSNFISKLLTLVSQIQTTVSGGNLKY